MSTAPAAAKTSGGPAPAGAAGKPGAASPARKQAKSRLVSMLRRVRNSPAKPVFFLLCIGSTKASVFLGPKVTPSQRVQLRAFVAGDAGLRFHQGRCVFEAGAYTFVGPTVTSGLHAKVERGLAELTGMKWRVKLRSGVVPDPRDATPQAAPPGAPAPARRP